MFSQLTFKHLNDMQVDICRSSIHLIIACGLIPKDKGYQEELFNTDVSVIAGP